jgi:hypothetical protein
VLENRKAEDVFPTHYRFNSGEDIRRLAERHGFRVVALRFLNTTAVTAALGPFAIPELFWLRFVAKPGFEAWRTNLIGVLEVAPEKSGSQAQPRTQ